MNSNDKLRDESIAQSIWVARYGVGAAQRMVDILNENDARLQAELMDALENVTATNFSITRTRRLLGAVRDLNSASMADVESALYKEVRGFAGEMADYQFSMFRSAIPESVLDFHPLIGITEEQVYAAAMAQPFQGKLLKEWMSGLETDRITRIENAITQGFMTGQTITEIARNVRGRANNGRKDGALELSRSNAATLTKTAMGHTAAVARQKFASNNDDLIKAKQWLSTLDNKTSHFCFTSETEVKTFGELKAVSRREYSGEMTIIATSAGNKLKGTPNHPILTSVGWRRLDEIKPGDKVINVDTSDIVEVMAKKEVGMISTIGDIFDSIASGGSAMQSSGSPAAEFNHHSTVWDAEVYVPEGKIHLWDNIESLADDRLVECLLSLIHNGSGFSGIPELLKSVFAERNSGDLPSKIHSCEIKGSIHKTFRSPSSGFSSEPDKDFLWSEAIIKQIDAIGGIFIDKEIMLAPLKFTHDSSLDEHSGDGSGAYAIFLSNLSGAKPRLVKLDDVVSVNVELCVNHVYNLQCGDSVYIANGLVVHNCRVRDHLRYSLDNKPVGHKIPYLGGPGAIHMNCRSGETYVLKSAAELGIPVKDMTPAERASMDGVVAGDTTYSEWFNRQSVERQTQIVGPDRVRLMREGGMSQDEFYSDKGQWLTLAQLRERHPKAFDDAGFD